ncbi:MAG: hypothetical protein IPI67_03110 [Myxococcales bacterium]|nr:hypothetical protein [Myxococcales bacterium]
MKRFPYYRSLSASGKRTYDKSDAIRSVSLPRVAEHRERAVVLRQALEGGSRRAVQTAAQALVTDLTLSLGVVNVTVRVLARRPKDHDGELHGLYTLEADGRAHLEVWMRTAEHSRTVAPRTFLRTLLHEVCHHLDFKYFGLKDTFHNAGFFQRESSLMRQLSEPAKTRPPPKGAREPSRPRKATPRREARQLSLFGP